MKLPVAVEKLPPEKFAEKDSRQDAVNDFLGSPRHFLSPDFRRFEGKASFSTATSVDNNRPVQQ